MLNGPILAALAAVSMGSAHSPSLCDVVAHPGRFAGQSVVVEANLLAEAMLLFDSRCNDADHWVLAEASDQDTSWERVWEHASLEVGAALRVRVSGVFDASNGVGYGHLGSFRTRLRVREVNVVTQSRQVRDMPAREARARGRERERQVSAMEERLFTALLVDDMSKVSEILAEDFLLRTPAGDVLYRIQLTVGHFEWEGLRELRALLSQSARYSSPVSVFELGQRVLSVRREVWLEGSEEGPGSRVVSPIMTMECLFFRVSGVWKALYCSVEASWPAKGA